jgi:hypothetical protein
VDLPLRLAQVHRHHAQAQEPFGEVSRGQGVE